MPAPGLSALVALAMERLGAANARQLAEALEMTDIDRERRVRRWVSGENAPNFDYTMLMLSKAGLLTPEADRAWRAEVLDPQAEARAAAAGAAEAADQADQLEPEERARRAQGNR